MLVPCMCARAAATGSYLTVSPASLPFPPRVYQAGGPVAQAFSIDPTTDGYGDEIQEVIYLDGGKRELLDPRTDKTRVALRYGSHAVDIDPVRRRAYIPHVCVRNGCLLKGRRQRD